MKIILSVLIAVLMFGLSPKSIFAQESQSVLYIPLIGITSVPNPLALPKGEGNVTYKYAVKNFLRESPLTDVKLSDDVCPEIKFVEGDDNRDSNLDYSETWRYSCTTKLTETTQNTVTATGQSYGLTATHKAYATVVVGAETPPPLVSIINITKVANPLFLPAEGGEITFTYKVNNPGIVPISDVKVTDDKCREISSRLGDTNGNNLLDVNEVWIYNCTAMLKETTTNTARVSAIANGLRAVGTSTITVPVKTPIAQAVPGFPMAGAGADIKLLVWEVLAGILGVLILIYVLKRRNKPGKPQKKYKFISR